MEENRITVVQALDERDLLVKKIMHKTKKAQFMDLIRPKAAVTWEKRLTREAFAAEAQRALQQIQDLIARYDWLNAVITQSNAATYLETSRGRMTVSGAIALRNRLRGSGPFGELTDFEGRLVQKMEDSYREWRELQRRKNEAARREASSPNGRKASAKIVILQEAGTAKKSSGTFTKEQTGRTPEPVSGDNRPEKPIAAFRLADPLRICKLAEELAGQKENLLAELETKIKISNATTYIEIVTPRNRPGSDTGES